MENGLLIVSNGGYGVTERIPFGVSEKTLSAWVKLFDLNQRAGGAITLQTPTGVVFDSIVYAEKQTNMWMSGSNNFRRTENFTLAPQEKMQIRNSFRLSSPTPKKEKSPDTGTVNNMVSHIKKVLLILNQMTVSFHLGYVIFLQVLNAC